MVIGSHICSEMSMKTKKKSGKTVRKSGKNQGISWDKKSGNPVKMEIILEKLGSFVSLERWEP